MFGYIQIERVQKYSLYFVLIGTHQCIYFRFAFRNPIAIVLYIVIREIYQIYNFVAILTAVLFFLRRAGAFRSFALSQVFFELKIFSCSVRLVDTCTTLISGLQDRIFKDFALFASMRGYMPAAFSPLLPIVAMYYAFVSQRGVWSPRGHSVLVPYGRLFIISRLRGYIARYICTERTCTRLYI